MTIYHIVLFKFKPLIPAEEVQTACARMLALKTKCIHPKKGQEYLKTAVGGKNNSPEGLTRGFDHAFISEFENEEDRKYYLEKDPAHLDFVKYIGKIIDEAQIVDFSPGLF